MEFEKDGCLLRIFIGENDRAHGRPLYEWLIEEAKRQELAGATAMRGLMGFGRKSRIHTSRILRLSSDLPVVIEIVDRFFPGTVRIEIDHPIIRSPGDRLGSGLRRDMLGVIGIRFFGFPGVGFVRCRVEQPLFLREFVELAEVGQIFQILDAEDFEKSTGRAVEHRPAGYFALAGDSNQMSLEKASHRRPGIHPAHFLDLGARHGLPIGDDCERFERGRRESKRPLLL